MEIPGINKKKDNIFMVTTPYYLLYESRGEDKGDAVIFWGADFRNFPESTDRKEFVKRTNLCLDYVRRVCAGCHLYYKPHPAETDEFKFLNLESFEMVNDSSIGEVFLWKNIKKIKYNFSVCSGISFSAYNMGLNSYVFSELFNDIFNEAQVKFFREHLGVMPPSAFISDLNQNLQDNKPVLKKDDTLEKNIARLLNQNNGGAYFVLADPMLLPMVISFTRLIKSISPGRKITLIIVRHHRWDRANISDIKSEFNEIIIFPRAFYSLRPNKLLAAWKVARDIRNLKIGPEDIIFGLTSTSLVENCLISYNKNNFKITLSPPQDLDLMYGMNRPKLFSEDKFKSPPASVFYNKFFEPLLGLNRTLYLKYGDGRIFNISRYQRPLNDVYDQVFVLSR